MTKYDAAANVALFLLDKVGDIKGSWAGKLTAKAQRELFGKFLGKGTLVIDGMSCTVEHWATVCFGTDSDMTGEYSLITGEGHRNGMTI